MIHSYEGVERTPAWTELVPVLVVRVPVMSAEQKAGLRAEIASSILDGLLLLEDGLGCFGALAKVCGKGVTETTLRNLYSGDEVQPIQVWRQVGAGLEKLGVSKSDTRKERDGNG